MGERGATSDALAAAASALAAKPSLASLAPARLLELAVASTKSASLVPVVGGVARTLLQDACVLLISSCFRQHPQTPRLCGSFGGALSYGQPRTRQGNCSELHLVL